MATKRMTLTERRKRIRQIREALSLALVYTQPGELRNIERSDDMLAYGTLLSQSLCNDLVENSVSGRLHQMLPGR